MGEVSKKDELTQEMFTIDDILCRQLINKSAGAHMPLSEYEISYLRKLLTDRRGKVILEYDNECNKEMEAELFAQGRSCSNCCFAGCNDPRWEKPKCYKENIYRGVNGVCELHKFMKEMR